MKTRHTKSDLLLKLRREGERWEGMKRDLPSPHPDFVKISLEALSLT